MSSHEFGGGHEYGSFLKEWLVIEPNSMRTQPTVNLVQARFAFARDRKQE